MKYMVMMKHYTCSVGSRQVDYPIEETIIAEGFETQKDAEDYAQSCRAFHFNEVEVIKAE